MLVESQSALGLPLSGEECDQLLARHGVPEAGRERVHLIRHSPPERRVRSGSGRVTGSYPSQKMRATREYESTIELAVMMRFERDPTVLEYYAQPKGGLRLLYRGKDGDLVRTRHVVDFFVVSEIFLGYVECKPEEKFVNLAERQPGRWQRDEDGVWRSEPAEQSAARLGLGYRIESSSSINWTLEENAEVLRPFLDPRCSLPDERAVAAILSLVSHQIGVTLEELVHKTGDADAVHALIAHGRVHVDLARRPLHQSHEVLVFPDESLARTWEAARASVPDWIESSAGDVGLSDPAAAVLEGSSDGDRAVALQRYEAIKSVLEGQSRAEDVPDIPRRTLYSWISAYRGAERDFNCGFAGLLPRTGCRGNRIDRLGPELRDLMLRTAKEFYATATSPTNQGAYTHFVGQCKHGELDPSSYFHFCRFLNALPGPWQTRRRKGRKAAVASAPTIPVERVMLSKDGLGPCDLVHIDHTQLDLFLRFSTVPAGEVILERPWLTLALCAWSRRVLGYYLSFDKPSYMACMMVVRDMVCRVRALPRVVMVDHGSEFKSVAFDQLCAGYVMEKRLRPPSEPRYGAPCERMFGTTNTGFVYLLSGNTQNLRDPRGMSAEVDPRRHALWSLPEFTQRLEDFLFSRYDTLPHEALSGSTPRQCYESGLTAVGIRRPRQVEYNRKLFLLTLPPAKRGTANVRAGTGIQLDNIVYNAPGLARWDGKRVPVRVDPDDAGRVHVPVGGSEGWIECRSRHFAALRGRSLKEVRAASMAIRATAGKGRKSPRVTAEKIAPLLADITQHEAVEKQRLRDEERRRASTVPVPGGAVPIDAESSESSSAAPATDHSGSVHGSPDVIVPSWDSLPEPVEVD